MLDYGKRAMAITATLEDRGLQLDVRLHMGQAYCTLGDYVRAIETLTANASEVGDDLRHERFGLYSAPYPLTLGWLGVCYAEQGEFDRAAELGREALRIAEAVDGPVSVTVIRHGVARVHQLQGALRAAMEVLEPGLRVAENIEAPAVSRWLQACLALVYAQAGRCDEAIPLAEMARDQGSAELSAWLGEVYLLAGRHADAAGAAQHALDLACRHRERGHEARALRLLGEIAARAEPPDVAVAEARYGQARALAAELGMRPLVAHCHLGLGTLHAKLGRTEDARTELIAAAELYRAMEMPFWLERADTVLGGTA